MLSGPQRLTHDRIRSVEFLAALSFLAQVPQGSTYPPCLCNTQDDDDDEVIENGDNNQAFGPVGLSLNQPSTSGSSTIAGSCFGVLLRGIVTFWVHSRSP